jgi:hypothetical protein
VSNKVIYQTISEQQTLPLFHRPWWLDMVCDDWDVAIAEDNGTTMAVWPYCRAKKWGLNLLRNPLMTPYLGPYFLLPQSGRQYKNLNKQDKAYAALWQQLPAWDFFSVQCLPGYNNFLPFHQRGFSHMQRVTYHMHLDQTENEMLEQMDSSKRRHVKLAAEDLVVAEGGDVRHFYELHRDTLVRKGEKYPYSEAFFQKLISNTIAKNAGIVLSARNKEGTVTAMMFVVYDDKTMYLLISAINQQAVHNGAVALLIWEAIKKAKKMGLQVFDFEGSMDKGIENFFRSFGGERVSYLSCDSNKSTIWKLKQALLG